MLLATNLKGFIMNVTSNMSNYHANENAKANTPNESASENAKMRVAEAHTDSIQTNFTEKISKEDAAELRAQITQNANDMMLKSTTIQVN